MNPREDPPAHAPGTDRSGAGRLYRSLLGCALIVVPLMLGVIHAAPPASSDAVALGVYAGVASLAILLIFAILGVRLMRPAPSTDLDPAFEALRRAAGKPTAPDRAPAPDVATLRRAARGLDDAAIDAESRIDRRARMAALMAEVRSQAQAGFETRQGGALSSAAIAHRLATLSGDSARCAERATQLLAAANGSLSQAAEHRDRRAAATIARAGDSVQGLSERSAAIGEIVTLIQSIASQSNLLSLNATIEAARAGETGKGFVALAHEVKSLAGQTACATDRVAEHVAAIRRATDSAIAAMSGLARAIDALEEQASGAPAGASASDVEILQEKAADVGRSATQLDATILTLAERLRAEAKSRDTDGGDPHAG